MARNLRVYELGRHYGVDSKQIMVLLEKMNVEAKSHMSIVEEKEVDRVHSVFQRKRELARENYAKAHGLNPDQLKTVAALKPLERPEAPDEPEPVKKAPKKKAAKKKKASAKPKVVVIKKAGTMTKVAKEAAAKRESEIKSKYDEAAVLRAEVERLEAELEAKRNEHAKARIVKKVDVEPAEVTEETAVPEDVATDRPEVQDVVESASAEKTAAEEAVAVPAEDAGKSADQQAEQTPEATLDVTPEVTEVTVETSAEVEPETGSLTKAADVAKDSATADQEQAPEIKSTSDLVEDSTPETETADVDEAVVTEGTGKKKKLRNDPLDKKGIKKNDGFKVGDIIRAAPKIKPKKKPEKQEAPVNSETVRDSIKVAIQRRQDEAAAAEVSSRKKRTRKKKKKVDQAEVDRQLKLTMAQMEGAGGKKKRKKGAGAAEDEDIVEVAEVLKLTEFITVQELSDKLGVRAQELIGKLFGMGLMVTINQRLEKDSIEMLVSEFEREVEFLTEYGEEVLEVEDVKVEDMTDRPPVVTVMGHVDHGKTSLLDSIRKTNVIAGEAGGITQHIGAYTVETDGGPITFLDTPGHAAFTAMRARGAQVTDIVILIVAADDRVMPQTIEAISHAKASGVPLIVAINKIDLPAANVPAVKQELLQHELVVEEYGGDILCAEISAKQGLGIDHLLELVHLQAEVLELKASCEGNARGVVIEAKKEPGRGVVFTVLIDQGTLKSGDNFLVGMQEGKVKALLDERGNTLEQVRPGEPCEVLGGKDTPLAGDRLYVLKSEREVRDLATKRRILQRQQQLMGPKPKIDLDNLAELMSTGDLKDLPIIIKGDVAGSVEALADQFMELNTEEVAVKVIHKAVGAISESDVLLAGNTGAMIIGFHMRPGSAIKDLARKHNVTIEVFDIIYEAVDTMKKAMAGLLGSIKREVSTGRASVRQVFTVPKVGSVAGSMVVEGVIKRHTLARLIRDEVVVYEGKVNSLKRFKDDVKDVATGYECGIGLENFYEIQEGDFLETFEIEEIERTEL